MYQAKCQNTKTFSFPILEISRKAIAICQINLDLPIVIDNIINIFWQVDNMVLISDELEITIVRINKCTFGIESERMSSKDSVKKVLNCNLGPQFIVWPNFWCILSHVLQGLPLGSRPITSPN